ncbi:hypothetical protein MHK_001497 [Candidatus Magnetomorum sp. HK-1]|nr:hypothetical protein MHK_001497 [Candidatus Magnetomorum sp. HK-1]
MGVTLAFNTIGWESQNVLFNTINALIGTDIGDEQPSEIHAYITDTALTTGGNLSLSADQKSKITSSVSNESTSAASALFNASGIAVSGILSSNMVSATAKAYIENSDSQKQINADGNITVNADGSISATASNTAKLNATISNAPDSSASALHGASGTGASGLLASNMVSSGVNAYINNIDTQQNIVAGGDIKISAIDEAGIYSNTKIVSSSIVTNDGGMSYINDRLSDLSDINFLSDDGEQTIKFGDRILLADDYIYGGNAGNICIFMGEEDTIDLSTEDYTDIGYWKKDSSTQVVPEGLNISDSDSMAIGGLVVRNDVRSFADAYVNNANVTAGSLEVSATEDMIIKATADSTTESSGGNAFGDGQSLAVNGVIATNLILSQADSHISNSVVQTNTGDVHVDAKNSSIIDAKTLSSTTSGDTGVAVTLAFNTIGWDAQNILFATLDTLLGTDALGNADPSDVKAYIQNSSIDAYGNITVYAESTAHINATVSNKTDSTAYALMNASSMAIGSVLVSNMVHSSAEAFIDSATDVNITAQNGSITIEASDDATIIANSEVSAISLYIAP